MTNNKKQMTLDDLAVLVADGFNDVGGRLDKLDGRMDKMDSSMDKLDSRMDKLDSRMDKLDSRMDKLDSRMDKLDSRMDNLDGRMDNLDNDMKALRSSVNNYLDLSDKRYLELKHRDALLARWVKAVADKTGVPVDLEQLEKTS